MRIRKNVNEIKDGTLLWYSKAVEEMKKRDISDPTSWWYQAAIHGIGFKTYTENPLGHNNMHEWSEDSIWKKAKGIPQNTIQAEALADEMKDKHFWQQCQHGSWYFLPWHRMYLYFFERIVSKTIQDLGGPDDWTLPYWNYFNAFNPKLTPKLKEKALFIPQEFGFFCNDTHQTQPNPDFPGLWIEERQSYKLNPRTPDHPGDLWDTSSMQSTGFVGEGPDGFGGEITDFSHNGRYFGALENNPHNTVHDEIGGTMGDPNTAALDPIFWLHHANIDRLWQSWIENGNTDTTDKKWLNQVFYFHNEHGEKVSLSPSDVLNTQQLDYTYSENYSGLNQTEPVIHKSYLRGTFVLDTIAASIKPLSLNSTPISTSLDFISSEKTKVVLTHIGTESSPAPTAVYVSLENITGAGNIAPVHIFIKLPNSKERFFVGSLGLFGLTQASSPSTHSAGQGLNVQLNATEIVHQLRAHPQWKLEDIHIEVEPSRALGAANATIGRISIKAEV
ncbi:tyrosinase family protein [Pseudoalteromonas luteoviolacea]|nr:tyrosinase family protein [Pseudoalteromonas luteoviolacea]